MKYQWPAVLKHTLLILTLVLNVSGHASAQIPAKPPAIVPILTGKVAHITILGTKNVSSDMARAVLTLKAGDAYTPQAADKDIAALQDIGVFQNNATVSATPDPAGGVDLAYTVTEYPIVKGIQFTANTPNGQPSIPAAELIAQMKTQVGQALNIKTLVSDLGGLFSRTTGFFTKQGYIADFSSAIHVDPETGILIIPIVEYHIQSIQVTGNKRVKSADILARMHAKIGDPYDGKALNDDERSIYEIGQFRTVSFTHTIAGHQIDITFSVVEQAPSTGTLDEKKGKIIPFLYDPLTHLYPIIQVSINRHAPMPFIVDTGTSYSLVLDKWAAKELRLKEKGGIEKNADDVAYNRVSVQEVVLQGLTSKNNMQFNIKEAIVINLSSIIQSSIGQHVAGIVGLGMLEPVTSRFDFAAKTLKIFSAPHPPLHILGGAVLPLLGNDSGVLTVRTAFAPDTYADLVLDTGSDATQVPLSALDIIHPTILAYSNSSSRLYGVYVCPSIRLPKLDLGTISMPNVTASTLPQATRLSLGLDVLAGYRMTLDGPNGQLILEPSKQGGRYVKGWSDLSIEQTGDNWKVHILPDTSPAYLAGLRSGDKVVMVDGIHVRGLTPFQAENLLQGIAGKPLKVTVQRDLPQHSKIIMLTWVPLDAFSEPKSPTYGLALQKAPAGPWVIKHILHGCPGDLAGLQIDDMITQVQGEVVAKMYIDHFDHLVGQPAVRMEIERAGIAKPFSVQLTPPK